MNEIERYVEDVLHRIAPGFPGRHRIETDLRSHLAERVAGGEDASSAVARMGHAAEVARGFLESTEPPLARPADRLGGFLFDVGLGALAIASITLLAIVAVGSYSTVRVSDWPLPLAVALGLGAVIVFVLVILYFPVLETLFGQTAGKHVFGTFVARETGERVGFWTAVVRRIPFMFDIWPIDAVFLLFTARRQRAFDLAARTIVIAGGRRFGRPWGMVALLWLAAMGLGALAGYLGSG
ncbi:MAG TPA: RDD family protein [Gemmatimonadota bacterium]|nr:RDD family protein [Gemmatimonadota bacterium]